jgi:hypothetical protein
LQSRYWKGASLENGALFWFVLKPAAREVALQALKF